MLDWFKPIQLVKSKKPLTLLSTCRPGEYPVLLMDTQGVLYQGVKNSDYVSTVEIVCDKDAEHEFYVENVPDSQNQENIDFVATRICDCGTATYVAEAACQVLRVGKLLQEHDYDKIMLAYTVFRDAVAHYSGNPINMENCLDQAILEYKKLKPHQGWRHWNRVFEPNPEIPEQEAVEKLKRYLAEEDDLMQRLAIVAKDAHRTDDDRSIAFNAWQRIKELELEILKCFFEQGNAE